MSVLELGPLPIALIISILGSTLLVWHRHGGPRWMFGVGGFLFVLGRAMMAAICAFLLVFVAEMLGDGERWLLGAFFFAVLVAIGAWSVIVTVRVVLRDAFGPTREAEAKVRYSDNRS